MAAFNKVKSSDLTTMLRVASKIMPYLTTDMRDEEILSIVKTIFMDSIRDVENYRVPVDGYYSAETVDGMDVLVPDLTMNSQYLQSYIYGSNIDDSLALDSVGVDENVSADSTVNNGKTDSAGTADMGYTVPETTVPETDYSYYPDGEDVSYDDYTGEDDVSYYEEDIQYVDDDYDGFDDVSGEYYW